MDKTTIIWEKSMALGKRLCGCHQIPERSFFIRGYQLPLCARCTGIAMGHATSLLLCVLHVILPLWVSLLMLIPLIVDGGVQLLFFVMSNNARRFVTGMLYGVGSIQIMASIVLYLMSM